MVTFIVPSIPPVNPPSTILVGQIGNVFWLRVDGKGCFQNSISVKSAVRDRIESGVRDFVFDLDRCPMMDSTFLGTLTGVARDLRDCGGGPVTVLNVTARGSTAGNDRHASQRAPAGERSQHGETQRQRTHARPRRRR